MAESLQRHFENPTESAKTFKRIQSEASGLFEMKDENNELAVVIKKLRDSFGAPTQPTVAPYVYGPEIALTGLVINGKSVVFDQASRNFMQLASTTEAGSCPYLYSWHESQGAWVHHGKVIHVANGEDKERTRR